MQASEEQERQKLLADTKSKANKACIYHNMFFYMALCMPNQATNKATDRIKIATKLKNEESNDAMSAAY